MNPNHCPPELVLAGIIRQVDGKHVLGADALAQAILAHPGSRWGPAAAAATPEAGYELIPDDGDPEKLPRDAQQVEGRWWVPRYGCDSLAKVLGSVQRPKLPVPTDDEIRADFVAWYEDTYGEPPRGIPPSSDVIKLARYLLQRWSPQPAAWSELPVPTDTELEANFRAWFKAKHDTEYFGGLALCDAIEWGKHLLQQGAQPATPWPELSEEPADIPSLDQCCELAFLSGWQAACVKLQRQRGQAQPPASVAAWPKISDSLIRRLVGDIVAIAAETVTAACIDRHVDLILETRTALLEVLGLAAKEGAE